MGPETQGRRAGGTDEARHGGAGWVGHDQRDASAGRVGATCQVPRVRRACWLGSAERAGRGAPAGGRRSSEGDLPLEEHAQLAAAC